MTHDDPRARRRGTVVTADAPHRAPAVIADQNPREFAGYDPLSSAGPPRPRRCETGEAADTAVGRLTSVVMPALPDEAVADGWIRER